MHFGWIHRDEHAPLDRLDPLARDAVARLSWIHQEDRAPRQDLTADGLHQRGDEAEWEELQAAVAMGCGASAASGKVP